jgi:ParB family chromosome partitioning protein
MREQKQEMKLPKLDDLFTNQEQRDYERAEKVEEIDISKITDFPEHPFRVNDDDKMREMVNSVKEYGVILPVIVRPKENGTYEMISGHRRKRACELAGVKQIRCIVKNLTDDEATILMVDSNIQREEIMPSEKAFAYKLKLEAMKHQGKRVDLEENETSVPLAQSFENMTSREILGQQVGESQDQIRRYIRLTYLIPELLEEVDNKRIAFRPAVELSYLEEDYQYVVLNKLQYDEVSPSLGQAITLKKMQQEGTISEEKIENLLDKEKPNQKEFIKIHNERIDKYIPNKIKESGKVEDFIIQCVEEHNKRERLKQERNTR